MPIENSAYCSPNTVECGVFHIFVFNGKKWYKMWKWNEIIIAIKTAARNKRKTVLLKKCDVNLRMKIGKCQNWSKAFHHAVIITHRKMFV